MATHIRETPILTGKDAANFIKAMKEAENKKASAEEIAKIKADAAKIKAMFNSNG